MWWGLQYIGAETNVEGSKTLRGDYNHWELEKKILKNLVRGVKQLKIKRMRVRKISFFMQNGYNDDFFQVYVSIYTICMNMPKNVAFYVTLLFVVCLCMFFWVYIFEYFEPFYVIYYISYQDITGCRSQTISNIIWIKGEDFMLE